MALVDQLVAKIEASQAVVGVIGLGYVGLPLALCFNAAGLRVLGFDIDERKVVALREGRSYIKMIPSEKVQRARASGFDATSDYDRLREVDAVLICVPTPVGPHREPDLSYIRQTGEELKLRLRPGQLVVLESTTYPGTTREVLLPVLEQTGLKGGQDFYLAFSPEREDPGNPEFSTQRIPKIVSGLTPQCREAAAQLYAKAFTKTVPVGSLEVAELAKLLENIYRAVNIALVNEMKVLCDRLEVDIWEVIEAAATKPFGFTPFYPGPGIGGHCIPVDPYYLTWRAREFGLDTHFIELAGQVNRSMPGYVVSRLATELNRQGKCLHGAKVLCLGIAYKKNVDDLRESPALEVMELLREGEAEVSYHDPHIPRLAPTRRHTFGLESVPLTPAVLSSADAVVILTDHDAVDYRAVLEHARLVIDTRHATRSLGKRAGNVRFA